MIRIGARRSPLAVAQAQWVADRLVEHGHSCELIGIESLGDRDRRRLTEIGGTGIFATAVRQELLDEQIDIAVHSLKDLPVDPAEGLDVAAIPRRADVRDVLVGLPVEQWADGTVVGTGSPRRAVQLQDLARRRGVAIDVVPVRGNVDTRFNLVRDGVVNATVLAAAGLLRLGRLDQARVTSSLDEGQDLVVNDTPVQLLALERMLPAAGQGALAIECRQQRDDELTAALAAIDDPDTRAAVTAERSFLSTLEAGCLAPVGAHARVKGSDLTLHVVAGKESGDDRTLLRAELGGGVEDGSRIGAELARTLLPQLDRTEEAE